MKIFKVETDRECFVIVAHSVSVRPNGALVFYAETHGTGTAHDPLVTPTIAGFAPGDWDSFWLDDET